MAITNFGFATLPKGANRWRHDNQQLLQALHKLTTGLSERTE